MGDTDLKLASRGSELDLEVLVSTPLLVAGVAVLLPPGGGSVSLGVRRCLFSRMMPTNGR